MAEYKLAENTEKKFGNELFEQASDPVAQNEESEQERTCREMLGAIGDSTNTLAGEPVFNGTMMYVPSADCHLYAIDIAKAQVVWKFLAGGSMTHAPTLRDGVIYVGSYDGHMYAIDERTGQELWRFRTGDMIQCKPLVLRDRIIFGSFDKNIYCLSLDGRELWRMRLPGFTLCEPLYLDGTMIFGTTDGRLYAISSDGRKLWTYFAGPVLMGSATYVKETDSVAAPTWDGCLHNVTKDGRALWKFIGNPTPQSRYRYDSRNGIVYFGSGDLQSGAVWAVDAKTGGAMWKFATFGRVQGTRCFGKMILCPSMEGSLYALAEDGKLLWKFQADGALNAPPACYNGLIYQCSWSGHIYCITEQGERVWTMYFPGSSADVKRVFSSMVRFSDKIRSAFRWLPELKPRLAYETKNAPQITLGPAAYRMSEPYKSEMKYEAGGPVEYTMGKRKDWRKEMQDRMLGKR